MGIEIKNYILVGIQKDSEARRQRLIYSRKIGEFKKCQLLLYFGLQFNLFAVYYF